LLFPEAAWAQVQADRSTALTAKKILHRPTSQEPASKACCLPGWSTDLDPAWHLQKCSSMLQPKEAKVPSSF
jgi:hypothetical protein